MEIRVTKNQKESTERLIARFTKKVHKSRLLIDLKEKRYWSKPKSRRVVRKAAIMREMYRKKKENTKYY
ncbi:hypothetical protein HZA39_00745 [Candidatus Peregrinibacteria bacterium]|nr:hypothetical protein [Candidatus Peregrinibacteria bacterium]